MSSKCSITADRIEDLFESKHDMKACFEVLNSDAVSGLLGLEDGSVDLVVTSPPYKDEDGYSDELMGRLLQGLRKKQKRKTLMFLNFGHLAKCKSRPFRVALLAEECGYVLHDTIIWRKNHYTPLLGNNLNNIFEYVFMFRCGDCPDLDRMSVGVPYADKSNVNRYGGGRDLRCRGNVWDIPYATLTGKNVKLHNHRFPVGLPYMCIALSGVGKGALVLDPFCGSGTAGVAALMHGCRFAGIEIDGKHVRTARERLEKTAGMVKK